MSVIKGTQHNNNDLSKQRNDDARFFVLIVLYSCVVVPIGFNADRDPHPAFYVNADPDIQIRVFDDQTLQKKF